MAWQKYKKLSDEELKKIEEANERNVDLCSHLPLFTDKYYTVEEVADQVKKKAVIREMMRIKSIHKITTVVKRIKDREEIPLTVEEVHKWISSDKKFQECLAIAKMVEQDKIRDVIDELIRQGNQYIVSVIGAKKCKELSDPKNQLNFYQQNNVQINDYSSMTQEERTKIFKRLSKSIPITDFKEVKEDKEDKK